MTVVASASLLLLGNIQAVEAAPHGLEFMAPHTPDANNNIDIYLTEGEQGVRIYFNLDRAPDKQNPDGIYTPRITFPHIENGDLNRISCYEGIGEGNRPSEYTDPSTGNPYGSLHENDHIAGCEGTNKYHYEFHGGNWNVPQYLYLKAGHDNDADDHTLTVTFESHHPFNKIGHSQKTITLKNGIQYVIPEVRGGPGNYHWLTNDYTITVHITDDDAADYVQPTHSAHFRLLDSYTPAVEGFPTANNILAGVDPNPTPQQVAINYHVSQIGNYVADNFIGTFTTNVGETSVLHQILTNKITPGDQGGGAVIIRLLPSDAYRLTGITSLVIPIIDSEPGVPIHDGLNDFDGIIGGGLNSELPPTPPEIYVPPINHTSNIAQDIPYIVPESIPIPTADPELIEDVKALASQVHHGFNHVDRWNRVLAAFGVIQHDNPMTAAEAQANTKKYSSPLWVKIANILQEREAAIEQQQQQQQNATQNIPQVEPIPVPIPTPTVDPDLIEDVKYLASQTHHGHQHVDRWNRVLATFGVIQHDNPMTAAEAQANTKKYSSPLWPQIAKVLKQLEAIPVPQQQVQPINQTSAVAQDTPQVDPEPEPVPTPAIDPELIEDVKYMASMTHHGHQHVDRWNKVLAGFGLMNHDNPMTAAEAEANSKKYSSPLWPKIAEVLKQLENAN